MREVSGLQDATAVRPAPSCLSTAQQPGEAEVFVLRVTGGDGPLVLGKLPPPSIRLGIRLVSRLLGLWGPCLLDPGHTYSVDTWEMAPERLLAGSLWGFMANGQMTPALCFHAG